MAILVGYRAWCDRSFAPHSHDATGHAEDTSKVGIRALKISLIGLGITAVLQLVIDKP